MLKSKRVTFPGTIAAPLISANVDESSKRDTLHDNQTSSLDDSTSQNNLQILKHVKAVPDTYAENQEKRITKLASFSIKASETLASPRIVLDCTGPTIFADACIQICLTGWSSKAFKTVEFKTI